MGQSQSSVDEGAPHSDVQTKTDNYELLGVERQATEDEIKKAYRRKAFELHPDRNYDNVENATKLFAEIQSAYEVLSDPQERAWYDSHRDVLLRGDQGGVPGAEEFSYNIRMTTAEEVLKLTLKFNCRLDMTDRPSGFYGGLREFFEKLANEEEIACQWENLDPVDYPGFGHMDDDYENVVRPFYAAWTGFATRKSYSWKDHYRLSEAPDRRIRRLMEKENLKLREEARQEFNDAVRSLIVFVRKRDRRFQLNQKSEAERLKILKEGAAAQAARSRAARRARLEDLDRASIPAWARSKAVDELEGGFSSSEESEEHEFECVVCNKTFKSEAQFQAHEKSKKHWKMLKQLQRDMREEGHELDLDAEQVDEDVGAGREEPIETATEDNVPFLERHEDCHTANVSVHSEQSRGEEERANNDHGKEDASLSRSTSEGDESDYAPRSQAEDRFANETAGLSRHLEATVLEGTPLTSDIDASSQPKVGKAKQRRAKKAKSKDTGTSVQPEGDFKCALCQASFPSKTKLFNHIKDRGHAAPISQRKSMGGGGKGVKGKK